MSLSYCNGQGFILGTLCGSYSSEVPEATTKQVPEVPIYPRWEGVDLEGISGGGGSLVGRPAVAPGSLLGHVQVSVSMGPAWCLLSALFAGCFTCAVPTGSDHSFIRGLV